MPDVHFSEVDSAFVEDSGRVEVTATVTSNKRRELALEAAVAHLSEADGVIRAGWREQTQPSNKRPAGSGGRYFAPCTVEGR